jgi:GTPase Era involved in 16S rRNA processing
VSAATGLEIAIGVELEPCTRNICAIKLFDSQHSDNDIVFIDTPGFDTLEISEEDILKLVSNWLGMTWVYPLL